MNKSQLQFLSKCSVIVLCIIGLIEFGFGLWSVVDQRYKTLAYTLVDVGYIVSLHFKEILLLNID